jgi:hypothetical protein
MQVLRKQAALARSFGVEVEVISPQRAGELWTRHQRRRPLHEL